MIWRRSTIAALLALGVAAPAEAGFWGDLKRSFGTAVDDVQHDGGHVIDKITGDGGDASDAAVGSEQSAPDNGTGDSADADSQPVDNTAKPVTDGSKQLSKLPKK